MNPSSALSLRPTVRLVIVSAVFLVGVNPVVAGELPVHQYLARFNAEFAGYLVGMCAERYQASASRLHAAFSNYQRSLDTAIGRFLAEHGKDASTPVPDAEASLQRLRSRAEQFMRTVDPQVYCPQLADRLGAVTADALYLDIDRSWKEFLAHMNTTPSRDKK
jgi:hypothetical protein